MADITLVEDHKLSMDAARTAAQKVADQMTSDYEMTCGWEGDVLAFKRSGVSGTLALTEGRAQLEISLGFMLKGFKSRIEEQVGRNMRKLFNGDAAQDAA
jgi:putative polyhydroxyalkanoate system protein